jgi:MFS family permease
MSVPPYVVAAITTTGAGWLSDRMQRRGPITMICASVGALGYLLLLVTPNPRANYAGLFLAAAGCYPLIPLIVSFGANNAGGSLKKGVAAAIIVSVGNAGGIISSFLYPKKDKPRYFPGHATNFAYCVATVIMAGFMTFYLEAQNKKKRARNAARTHDWTPEEKAQLEDRADANDWFIYTT